MVKSQLSKLKIIFLQIFKGTFGKVSLLWYFAFRFLLDLLKGELACYPCLNVSQSAAMYHTACDANLYIDPCTQFIYVLLLEGLLLLSAEDVLPNLLL